MNVDCNLNAITQSRRLCQRLGRYAKGMRFFHTIHPGDVDLKHCDVVYLAALSGLTQSSKEDIVLSTLNRMKDGALLIIRSVYGMRRLLYPVSIMDGLMTASDQYRHLILQQIDYETPWRSASPSILTIRL
jgi:nicotianamine synthase